MDIAAKLDDVGKPIWIVAMVLGFIWWWPLGMVTLAYLLWSGRMGRWKHAHGCWGRWHHHHDGGDARPAAPQGPSSGNRAFDEYRTETLRRLEEEQKEFREFLDRLRFAKDKTEFDQFMAERRDRPAPEAPPSTN